MADTPLVVNPNFEKAVDQLILDVERVNRVVNGSGTQEVVVEDGSLIPSIRKAMIDNLYFKTPPFPWKAGDSTRVFNQLYTYPEPNTGASWWYAPGATTLNPVPMKLSPHDDPNWRLIIDTASIADIYAPLLSPLFRGNPRGPTPGPGDDSNSLATTAFVTAAIAAAISLPSENDGDFFDIRVTNHADLNKVDVKGQANFKGQIDATTSQMLLNTLRLMDDDGKIDFAFQDPNFAGKLRTVLRPHTITTSVITVDNMNSKFAEIGDENNVSTPNLIVHGSSTLDYVRIKGNGKRPLTDPQLVVEGKAVIKDLEVTGSISGAAVGIDGKDIKPRSIDTGDINAVNINVEQKLTVGGDTTLNNLEIKGTIKGLTFPDDIVDGKNIKPKSVVATDDSRFNSRLTVKDLVVTGSTQGITTNVSGLDIDPNSVTASEGIYAGTTVTAVGDVLVGGNVLSRDGGPVIIPSTRAGLIVMSSLVEDIAASTYQLKVTSNVQNWTLKANNITLQPPAAPPGGAANFVIYIQQDATGGRQILWDPKFISLNPDTINTAPNSVTMVQLIYRGTGDLYDKVVTRRP